MSYSHIGTDKDYFLGQDVMLIGMWATGGECYHHFQEVQEDNLPE
jgi:hypothetical protein